MGKCLSPDFKKLCKTSMNRDRTRHIVTFNPNSANPGEQLYIRVPKLSRSDCLVPDSLHLVFDIKINNTKNRFKNNLAKILQSRLEIRYSGEVLYDCTYEHLYEVYKNKWLSLSKREVMVEYGVGSTNLRKLISKDDSGACSGKAAKVSEKLMCDVFGTTMRLKLSKILENIGLFCRNTMNSTNFE